MLELLLQGLAAFEEGAVLLQILVPLCLAALNPLLVGLHTLQGCLHGLFLRAVLGCGELLLEVGNVVVKLFELLALFGGYGGVGVDDALRYLRLLLDGCVLDGVGVLLNEAANARLHLASVCALGEGDGVYPLVVRPLPLLGLRPLPFIALLRGVGVYPVLLGEFLALFGEAF